MQLQVVFIFVVALLAIQAQLYLSGLAQTRLVHVAAVLVPYIAALAVVAVLSWAPWELPAKRTAAVAATSVSREPEEATGDTEADSKEQESAVEGPSEAERPSKHLVRALA